MKNIWRSISLLDNILNEKIRTIRSAPSTVGARGPERIWLPALMCFGMVFLLIEYGFRLPLPGILSVSARFTDYLIITVFLYQLIGGYTQAADLKQYLRLFSIEWLIVIGLLLQILPLAAGVLLIIIRNIVYLALRYSRPGSLTGLLRLIRFNTALIIAFSFIALIGMGTVLLMLPIATADGRGTPLVDGLFTAISATCVTGLTVRETSLYFSGFGQTVILCLVQIGGLGIMTFSAFLFMLFGRFSLGQRRIMQDMLEEDRHIVNIVTYIFRMTLTVEAIGAGLLFARWIFVFKAPLKTLYYSIFHAVSAFCNAGFSLFPDSLAGFVNDPLTNGIVLSLVVIGGLGFVVVYDVSQRLRKKHYILSAHTRLVLGVSLALIVGGFMAIFFFEFDNSFRTLPLSAKVMASLFQAVTPRTAGFNTVPIAALTPMTLSIIIILMFIGASPGSTGGGIKTTTFAVLLLSLRGMLRGREQIEIFKRTIPRPTVYRALAHVLFTLLILTVIFLMLLAFEQKPFLSLLFELVSAFGTVGLSMNVTPALGVAGKLLIAAAMYTGRVGPLTLAVALFRDQPREPVVYPDAKVVIG